MNKLEEIAKKTPFAGRAKVFLSIKNYIANSARAYGHSQLVADTLHDLSVSLSETKDELSLSKLCASLDYVLKQSGNDRYYGSFINVFEVLLGTSNEVVLSHYMDFLDNNSFLVLIQTALDVFDAKPNASSRVLYTFSDPHKAHRNKLAALVVTYRQRGEQPPQALLDALDEGPGIGSEEDSKK